MLRAAKRKGLAVTCEVTPHHLLLTDQEVVQSGFDTRFKMKPPLRASEDVAALLEGLEDGTIDVIASDHAPHTTDEKRLEFQAAPFGVVGLETTLSVCLDRLVAGGRISLSRLVALLSTNPARVFGLPGGTLRPGSPADVTVIDLEREVRIDPARFRSKGRSTPFEGWTLRGAAVLTVVGGRKVFELGP
jgi:dihydroorotase